MLPVLLVLSTVVAFGGDRSDAAVVNVKPNGAGDISEYTVVNHDTLWGISERFLKNPFKWPAVWKQNPHIKNPDLIYPGDKVRLGPNGIEVIAATPKQEAPKVEVVADESAPDMEKLPITVLQGEKVVVLEEAVPVAQTVKAELTKTEPVKTEEKTEPTPITSAVPAKKFSAHAMTRQGFINTSALEKSGAIVGSPDQKLYFNRGDVVFISMKPDSGPLAVGARFTIFSAGDRIQHPVTKKYVGNIIDVLGSLVITGVEGVAKGRIEKSFKEIPRGTLLRPYAEPVKEVEVTATEARVEGVIISALEAKENLSVGDVAYIDKGLKDGLKKGNVLRIYREEKKNVPDPYREKTIITMPPAELGKLIVADPGEDTSACVVLQSLGVIVWGDQVSASPPGSR